MTRIEARWPASVEVYTVYGQRVRAYNWKHAELLVRYGDVSDGQSLGVIQEADVAHHRERSRQCHSRPTEWQKPFSCGLHPVAPQVFADSRVSY